MGDLVAFPTETVYGLGANATNVDAYSKSIEDFIPDTIDFSEFWSLAQVSALFSSFSYESI